MHWLRRLTETRRNDRAAAAPADSRSKGPGGIAPAATVSVNDAAWHQALSQLDSGFRFITGTDPKPDALLMVSADLRAVRDARARVDGVPVLVVVPFSAKSGGTVVAVDLLESGMADACLIAPAPPEVVAHLHALLRYHS